MKKLYIAFSLSLASFAYSQVPQAFSYQTIAFNSAGAPIANGNVKLRISILDNSATGTVIYTETHTKTTNSKGLVNLNIGQGTATIGNFGGINWGTNTKFVKVEMDPAGGSNYTNVGVNQLMSVPYALVAGSVSTNSTNSSIGDDVIKNKSINYFFLDKYDHTAYVSNSKNGGWSSQVFNVSYYNNNYSVPAVTATNGSFMFIDKYDHKVYVSNAYSSTWSSQVYSISYYNNNYSSPTITTTPLGSYTFTDKYDRKVYTFSSKSSKWSSQIYNVSYYNNNYSIPNVITSGDNFAFIDKYDHKIYAYDTQTGSWVSQTYNISYYNNNYSSPILEGTNGNFIFTDKYDHKVYVFNSKKGLWESQVFDISYYNNNYSLPVIISSETN
ncbi:MAG: hypothetical protein DI529_14490 [Chryseobacterium sp.]|nr:MAG: hypothetical protein DI529_14490 [Chryseobacterium sp.]